MGKPYNITITNGVGTANILNDTYSITSNTTGYLDSSIDPASLTIVEGTNEYELKISAEGTLTLHVTETGEQLGTPVVGAKFIRCDRNGTTYGTEVTTDSSGNAVFLNVPYDSTNAPNIYFKQTESDGSHIFDDTLKTTTLSESTKTEEVINALPTLRTIKLTDANYEGLGIESGNITLS